MSDTSPRTLQIFLCYAHEDEDQVYALYERIQTDGFHPWMDREDLIPGQEWEPAIRTAVRESAVILVCISQQSVTKTGFVNSEIAFALDIALQQPEGSIFIIPLRLENSPVPERLKRFHWCDYFKRTGYDKLMKALQVRAVQLGIVLPQPQPQQPASQPQPQPVAAEPVPQPQLQPQQVTPPPQPVIQPVASPPLPSRTNPLYPVTIAEWRDEEKLCTTDFGKPLGYWCYVRPGKYPIGGWKGDKAATITLSGFWIAKFPITVLQYRQFIAAGGYANKDYWTPNGWQWKQQKNRTHPYWWGEKRFSEDNQPVVGLWLYEATAFAAWLDAELAGNAPSGTRIRLPTEAEWEVAAAYDANNQRRTYPWGEQEPDATLADFGKNKPAPIGNHAAGAAACGAENMGGSVWECTMSDHAKYPVASGVVVDDNNGWVPWRGGSWVNHYTVSCCSARTDYFDDGNAGNGVRVARLFS